MFEFLGLFVGGVFFVEDGAPDACLAGGGGAAGGFTVGGLDDELDFEAGVGGVGEVVCPFVLAGDGVGRDVDVADAEGVSVGVEEVGEEVVAGGG